ncbi:MAG: hypothetical protein QW067_11065 [Thermofilaceae archaeon]
MSEDPEYEEKYEKMVKELMKELMKLKHMVENMPPDILDMLDQAIREKKAPEQKLVKCPNCGHEWWTRSKMKYITCPSCQKKFRVDTT